MFATIAGSVCSKTDQPLRDQGGILEQPERSTAESSISSTDNAGDFNAGIGKEVHKWACVIGPHRVGN